MFAIKFFQIFGLVIVHVTVFAQDTIVTNYPNTQQRWEKIFKNNQKVAENIFHSNGSPWMTVQYDNESVEHWKWYYADQQPYFEATILKDRLQGDYKIWYENGQLAESLTFKDNLENGLATFYHPNGQVAIQGQYKQGEMVGRWTFFDQNGKSPEGTWVWSFAAMPEDIRMIRQLKNGQPTGVWTYRTTSNQGKPYQKEFQKLYE